MIPWYRAWMHYWFLGSGPSPVVLGVMALLALIAGLVTWLLHAQPDADPVDRVGVTLVGSILGACVGLVLPAMVPLIAVVLALRGAIQLARIDWSDPVGVWRLRRAERAVARLQRASARMDRIAVLEADAQALQAHLQAHLTARGEARP